MSLVGKILRFAAPLPRVEAFDRYLFIGPHPDDIEIGAGKTAAKLAAMGKSVTFLICTDGRYGDTYKKDLPEEELAELREEEAVKSAAALGVTDVRFLGLSDGGFYDEEELFAGICRVMGEVQPKVIFAPDGFVGSECHRDHLNVASAAKRAAYLAPYEKIMARVGAKSAPAAALCLYMTARPNRFVKTPKLLPIQLFSIFGCHKSQFPEGCNEISSIGLYLKLRSAIFGLRRLCTCAEGFRMLDVTRMHCLPEADE